MMKVLFHAVLAIGCLGITSCRDADQIVGKWEWGNGVITEYFQDGRFLQIEKNGEQMSGRWQVEMILTVEMDDGGRESYRVKKLTLKEVVLEAMADEATFTGKRLIREKDATNDEPLRTN